MNDLVERARVYAVQNHARINQRLKYSFQPYDVHLKAVADLVASVTDDPESIAAAWLHDTLDDTPATFEDLIREFGPGVACLVTELTDISKPSDGNRAARKEVDRRHLALASPRAKTVKLADLIVNSQDICKHDERFGRVYIVEMMALLAVLHEGDAILYERAERVVEKCARTLGVGESSSLSEQSDGIESSPQEVELFSRYRGIRLLSRPSRPGISLNRCSPLTGGAMRRACDRPVTGKTARWLVFEKEVQSPVTSCRMTCTPAPVPR